MNVSRARDDAESASAWAATLTFFPVMMQVVRNARIQPGAALVVGASDGKFVVPLARDGWTVTAVEVDATAIRGGEKVFPAGPSHLAGLEERIARAGVTERTTIVEADFLEWDPPRRYELVFTSCSWHYSRNRRSSVRQFIQRMQACTSSDGALAAEYMLPDDEADPQPGYVTPEEVRAEFSERWDVLLELATARFYEAPHVDNLVPHHHRMGVIVAVRRD